MRALLLIVLLLPLSGPRAETPVTLSAPEGYPNTYTENGVIKGLFVELVQEAFRRQNRQVEIRIQPWLRAIEETRLGHSDGMFVIYRNPERDAYFDFPAEPLTKFSEAVFVPNIPGAPARFDPAQPSGKRIGIVSHSYHGRVVDPALRSGRFSHLSEIDSYDTLVRMLAAGHLDIAIAVPDPIIDGAARLKLSDRIKRLPDLDQVPAYLTFTRQHDMSAEKKAFEDGIRSMKADGTYDVIAKKYRK